MEYLKNDMITLHEEFTCNNPIIQEHFEAVVKYLPGAIILFPNMQFFPSCVPPKGQICHVEFTDASGRYEILPSQPGRLYFRTNPDGRLAVFMDVDPPEDVHKVHFHLWCIVEMMRIEIREKKRKEEKLHKEEIQFFLSLMNLDSKTLESIKEEIRKHLPKELRKKTK